MASSIASPAHVESLHLQLTEVSCLLRDLHWLLLGQYRCLSTLNQAEHASTFSVPDTPSLPATGREHSAATAQGASSTPSRSKLRRQRARATRYRLWESSQKRTQQDAGLETQVHEELGAGATECEEAVQKAMQETEVCTRELAADDDVKISCAAVPASKLESDEEDGSEEELCQPEMYQYDRDVLESLRGQPKQDAVLNLLLNRPCTVGTVDGIFRDIEKYFVSELDRVGSFLGMKFGIGSKSWEELKDCMQTEISENEVWAAGLTLGMVLAQLRRAKSTPSVRDGDERRESTNRLTQPRRNKAKRRK